MKYVMKITKDTKISKILKANAAAIDVIAGINKHFRKLKNPVLRKVLAPRVTVKDAAKIGHVSPEEFLKKLESIGFEVDYEKEVSPENNTIIIDKSALDIVTLDVRPVIESGADPFKDIMRVLKDMPETQTLKIINVFEPVPLIKILEGKGYKTWTEAVHDNEYHTFFQIEPAASKEEALAEMPFSEGSFEEKLAGFGSNIREIDVRHLEMPEPMVTILKELERLPENFALFVNHKKVPQFLLPELKQRQYQWTYREMTPGHTQILIYKDPNS